MRRNYVHLFAFVKSKRFYGVTGSLIGLFLLLNYVFLPLYVHHGSTLYVPRVVSLPIETAKAVLDSAGLEGVEAETKPDPVQPLGTVTGQNPFPQAIVKHGRRIYLTVSGGDVLVAVPSLRGRSSRDAKFTLERAGLRLGGTSYAVSDAYPENTIIDQSISPETKVGRGASVNIVVSRGNVVEETVVPSLIGKTTVEAGKLLEAAGLRGGNITYQPSFDLLPNTVVDQYPRSGEPAKRGQAVDMFVVQVGKPTEEIQPHVK